VAQHQRTLVGVAFFIFFAGFSFTHPGSIQKFEKRDNLLVLVVKSRRRVYPLSTEMITAINWFNRLPAQITQREMKLFLLVPDTDLQWRKPFLSG
jgi:hypothetical protein